jgi:DNA-binding transcriptional MerR regulator
MSESMGIRALARRTGLSTHALRYYEEAGLMLDVPRDDRGHRLYSAEHERWVAFLIRLRETGMGISRIREYAEMTRGSGDPDGSRRLAMLREHRDDVRARVRRLHEHLEILERKVAAGCGPLVDPPEKRRESS